ncbi:bacteriocin biosynthesis cyclodehydratase domain-containing protein [Micromonospora pallida]|uniref:Bacteriocin biosynthesis cyclodehydratase domain-containing protein n=1 Tax=Micromonospora pallida TaxID=145854 RepID=A0A1C6RQE2_9ACTN|nr:TOMM precursor leader peptide-binding protein [Micromonospora pallida]SCL19430.1 bacteriocin biosynthesis cyclodehydratase domain-containing protein [Micromonospora pallida]
MSVLTDGDQTLEMRPKLRHDVVFLDAPAGAYLRGPDSAFLIKGRTAFRWLSSLSPYLNGEHSLGQLCADLDESQRRTVVSLVRALVSRGFAKDARGRADLAEPVARRFAPQIEFVDHFADDPTGRFARFHTTRVALGGSGETLLAAVTGLLRNGCVSLDVYPDDAPETYRTALAAEVDELRAEGVPAEVRVHTGPLDPTGVDAVVYCTDGTDLARLHELARTCHRDGPLLVPVYADSDRAVLGPVVAAGQTPCWLCAQFRLTASAEPAVAAEFWRRLAVGPDGGEPAALPQVTARTLGNAAAFELFRVRTGALAPDTGTSVLLLDQSTLESSRERVLPHPACPVCRDVEVPEATEDAAADEDETYQRAGVLVSDHAGVFTRFVDDPLEQSPLKTARLRVPGRRGPRELTTFDVHTVLGARLEAYRVAIREHVGRYARPVGAVDGTAAELLAAGHRPVPWTQLDTAAGTLPYDADRHTTWVPARTLDGAVELLVPAALVLPLSGANADGYAERTPAGAAVGDTLDAVIDQGLADALAYRALTGALRGRDGLVAIAEEDLVADEDTALVIKAAHRFGWQVALYGLAGAAPAHAVLAVTTPPDGGDRLWTLVAGFDPVTTRRAAARDLVGLIQVRHFEGVSADPGDPFLVDLDPATLTAAATTTSGAAPTATDRETVLAALAACGTDALLVETTTRDVRASGAFRSGVVLLHQRPTAD